MHSNAAAPSAGPSIRDSGLRGHLTSITSLLRRFPLSIHQLLFRLAAAGSSSARGFRRPEAGRPPLPLVYPQAWPEHLVWGSILVFLLTRGPGAFSLDRLIGLESSDSVSS